MRLTSVARHVERFWWGKGWGAKPARNKKPFLFREQWKMKSKRKIFEHFQVLPDGIQVEDPNEFVKVSLQREFSRGRVPTDNKVFPWPHSDRPIRGSSDDPNYQERAALVFNRHRRLLDPLHQSLFFTNAVLEGREELPESINHLMSDVKVDDDFLDLMQRRLEWCLTSDSTLRKLPLNREFPYLDQRPPRVWGIPSSRQENNYLRTLYDLTQILFTKMFGFMDIQKISYPYCVVPIERNERSVVLDLETDFISVSKLRHSLPLFSATPLVTIDKPLTSIAPLSWTTCFVEKNFYPTDYSFKMPDNHTIHTIYFTHNQVRQFDDYSLVGRAIFYCYGYTTAVARLMAEIDISSKELVDPIPVQCVFINPKDFSLGFVCFQLNTTSFDSSLKNQVWVKTGIKDHKQLMKHLLAFQANGFVDSITKNLKTSIKTNE